VCWPDPDVIGFGNVSSPGHVELDNAPSLGHAQGNGHPPWGTPKGMTKSSLAHTQ